MYHMPHKSMGTNREHDDDDDVDGVPMDEVPYRGNAILPPRGYDQQKAPAEFDGQELPW